MGRLIIALALASVAGGTASAQTTALSIGPMTGDHAVIQRGQPIAVGGDAGAGATVTVTLAGASGTAKADTSGHWQAMLPALPAGGPYRLEAKDGAGHVAASEDLMLGDVWLCSGQSNMELPVRRALNADNEAGTFDDPGLRLITIDKATATSSQAEFAKPPRWEVSSRDNVPEFSAACFYMVRDLRHAQPDVAIGAIDSTWGGTQIRAWLDPAATRAIYGQGESELLKTFGTDPLAANAEFFKRWADWYRQATGTAKGDEPWVRSDALGWKPVPSITFWDEWGVPALKGFNGTVWYRKKLTLTAAQAKQANTLSIGLADDVDETIVNGVAVGNTFSWSDSRNYALPARYWKTGANEILVAVTNTYAMGGLHGPADAMKLSFADGSSIALSDGWEYAIGTDKGGTPHTPWDQISGLGLIGNAMIAPLGPIRLSGAAWYQGESDVGQAHYDDRLKALINGWRTQFGQPELPVLVVGLANWGAPAAQPTESGWSALQDEQRKGADALAHVTLVPAIDLGERTDIHPANKIDLGHRLSAAAMGKPVPRVTGASRSGGDVIVAFDGVTGAWQAWNSDQAIGFELCGADAGSCRFARAVPDGTSVRISGDGKPVTRVRYAWADTAVINLYDGATLPVSSFEVPVE